MYRINNKLFLICKDTTWELWKWTINTQVQLIMKWEVAFRKWEIPTAIGLCQSVWNE